MEKQIESKGPSRYASVKVATRDGRVFVKPDPVQVFFEEADRPDGVRWYAQLPPGATRVAITWELGSPFLNWTVEGLGASREERERRGWDVVLAASGNTREKAMFKYTILFLDDDERVVAWVDPRVKNDPVAPVKGSPNG